MTLRGIRPKGTGRDEYAKGVKHHSLGSPSAAHPR